MTIQLNKDKKVGRILFIVEGDKTEFYVIHKILVNFFEFKMVAKKRNAPYKQYGKANDKDSIVYVINTFESAIQHIDNTAYIYNIYADLIENFDFELDNTQIYYIFDRDPKTNTENALIEGYIKKYRNSLDNDEDEPGLLLLSYPSFEAFTLSNFDPDFYNSQFSLGKQLKDYLHSAKHDHSKITEKSFILAVKGLLDALRNNGIEFEETLLDDFSVSGMQVHNSQEAYYKTNNAYKCLSLFVLAFIDIGLINITEEELR